MTTRPSTIILPLVCALFLAACSKGDDDGDRDSAATAPAAAAGSAQQGDEEVDNVAACEDLVDSLECGSTDFSQFVMCDLYADTSCDVSDYFACLEDNVSCQDGVLDPSKWMACTDLATCK